MRSSGTALLTAIVFVILIGASHGDAVADVNRWNGFISSAWSQGFVRQECPGQPPCQNDDFGLGAGYPSNAGCPVPAAGTESTVLPCMTFASAYLDTYHHLNGFAGHFPPPGGDLLTGTGAQLIGERVDADLFTVGGEVSTVGIWPGTVQVAVFQYSGDPTVFDGLEVDYVEELVDLGIIDSDDILAVETISNYDDVDLQVQVTGIDDDEIVIFAAGDGRIPPLVPATNAIGTAVLLIVMLVLGVWALRRRNARAV